MKYYIKYAAFLYAATLMGSVCAMESGIKIEQKTKEQWLSEAYNIIFNLAANGYKAEEFGRFKTAFENLGDKKAEVLTAAIKTAKSDAKLLNELSKLIIKLDKKETKELYNMVLTLKGIVHLTPGKKIERLGPAKDVVAQDSASPAQAGSSPRNALEELDQLIVQFESTSPERNSSTEQSSGSDKEGGSGLAAVSPKRSPNESPDAKIRYINETGLASFPSKDETEAVMEKLIAELSVAETEQKRTPFAPKQFAAELNKETAAKLAESTKTTQTIASPRRSAAVVKMLLTEQNSSSSAPASPKKSPRSMSVTIGRSASVGEVLPATRASSGGTTPEHSPALSTKSVAVEVAGTRVETPKRVSTPRRTEPSSPVVPEQEIARERSQSQDEVAIARQKALAEGAKQMLLKRTSSSGKLNSAISKPDTK